MKLSHIARSRTALSVEWSWAVKFIAFIVEEILEEYERNDFKSENQNSHGSVGSFLPNNSLSWLVSYASPVQTGTLNILSQFIRLITWYVDENIRNYCNGKHWKNHALYSRWVNLFCIHSCECCCMKRIEQHGISVFVFCSSGRKWNLTINIAGGCFRKKYNTHNKLMTIVHFEVIHVYV